MLDVVLLTVCSVERPVNRETTSLGAAFAAGLAVGVWKGKLVGRRATNTDCWILLSVLDQEAINALFEQNEAPTVFKPSKVKRRRFLYNSFYRRHKKR